MNAVQNLLAALTPFPEPRRVVAEALAAVGVMDSPTVLPMLNRAA
jgi:hypothetical protein